MIPADIDNFVVTNLYSLYQDIGSCIKIPKNTTSIPREVSNIKSLSTIYITGSRLKNISGLSSCTSLVDVEITDSAVTDISPFFKCVTIRRLRLGYNKIDNTDGLSKSKLTNKLVSLDLSGNKITTIPLLNNFKMLRHLILSNNPLSPESISLLDRDIKRSIIISYI